MWLKKQFKAKIYLASYRNGLIVFRIIPGHAFECKIRCHSFMCGIGFQNPWWSAPMAFAPALLATILIFMDQQITSVIVNRKENKLMVRPIAYYLS